MKKLIAMLACLTLVITMFAGLTVSAADYGTPTFKLVPQTEADGSLAVVDGCYVVDVVYEGFENFAVLSGSSRKPSATGIMGLEIYWSNDNDAAYVYDGSDEGLGVAGGSTEVATISATKVADIVTATEGVICSAYYVIEDEEAVANLTIDSVVVNVRKYVENVADETGKVDFATADVNLVGCTLGKTAPAPVDPVVTYEGEENLVWGAQGAYAEGKATFSVKPVMGYTVAVTANGEAVAIDAAKGGEVTIDVTEDTKVVATATAITDAAYTYNEKYVDESGVVYVFGKATAAPFGFYLEKDGAALKNKALEIYDGKFEANGTAGAFGMGFAFTGEGHTGAYTATVYDANGVADSSVAFNID